MQLYIESFNPFHTNCYFLTDEVTGSTVIIDPGCYFRRERTRVQRLILLKDWHVERVVATHLHIDHVFGASFLKTLCGCPLEAALQDNYWVELAPQRCKEVGLELRMPIEPVEHFLQQGDIVRFGGEELSVFQVPGHSPGSLVFYHSGTKSLFTGDTLFRRGIGRTDLPGGNRQELLENIRRVIFSFPDDTIVYPGHYEATTVGDERRNNPFLRGSFN